MDPLSDLLHAVRLVGAAFIVARLSAPWSFRSPPAEALGPALGLRAECYVLFHILIEGRCWLVVDDSPPVRVEGGTAIVLPHGQAHLIASRLDLAPDALGALLQRCTGDGVRRVSYGRGGESCRLLYGVLACDQRLNPLIGALPALLLACPHRGWIAVAQPGGAPRPLHGDGRDDDEGLGALLAHAVDGVEVERPGGAAMLARRVELLYLELLHRCAEQLQADRTGVLAAIRHPEVGRALRLLHGAPQQHWTVEGLAREVRLSRSTLGQRFAEVLGEPPMHYLGRWRIQLAKELLRQPELSVAQVATRVGYHSAVAFHRAFKGRVGETPASWRAGVSPHAPSVPGRTGTAGAR